MTKNLRPEPTKDQIDAMLKAVAQDIMSKGVTPDGLILEWMKDIGFALQGIPSKERKLTVLRLRNKADLLRQSALTLKLAQMIDALIEGWEAFGTSRDKL